MSGRRYNPDVIKDWFERGILLGSRRIYLGSVVSEKEEKDNGIDFQCAELLIKGLELMQGSRKKINLILNTIGGDWFHAMAIYDAIRASKAPVDIEVYGQAMSMGAVILQAGRNRIMHPNAVLMIHDGYSGVSDRPIQTGKNWADFDEITRNDLYKILSQRTGKTPVFWRRKCSHDTIYTAKGAVECGLADRVAIPSRALPIPKKHK